MTLSEKYVKIRDEFDDNEVILWEDFARAVGVEVPVRTTGPDWAEFVAKRNGVKYSINEKARKNGQNWRLRSFNVGMNIIKKTGKELLNDDPAEKLEKIISLMVNTRNEVDSFKKMKGITKKQISALNDFTGMLNNTAKTMITEIEDMSHTSKDGKKVFKEIVSSFDGPEAA